MNRRRPGVTATDAGGTVPIDWDETVLLFAAERWYWVATAGDEGRPHLRPTSSVPATGAANRYRLSTDALQALGVASPEELRVKLGQLLPAGVVTEPLQPRLETAASATTEALVKHLPDVRESQLCAELTIMLHRASAAPIGGLAREPGAGPITQSNVQLDGHAGESPTRRGVRPTQRHDGRQPVLSSGR